MTARPPLYKLDSGTLRAIARTGSPQERHTARTILAMRANADNPRATTTPASRRPKP